MSMNYAEYYCVLTDIHTRLSSIQWPKNAQEPDYVAKLVEELPSLISHSLSQIIPRERYSVGGAFIHQKPLARFINKPGYKKPELGDFLIVCREKRFSGFVYNAILLQAKCADNPLRVTIPNDHQFLLYSEWPGFEYNRAGILNGKKRSVLPKTITQGAQYLLISRDSNLDDSDVELFTATVDRPLSGSRFFSGMLALLLTFNAGRTFQVSHPRDDWSQMILDLLILSANTVFNRRNIGYKGVKRWKGDSSFLYLLNTDEKDWKVDNGNSHSGMGVICVDMDSSAKRVYDE